jgi:hypothetical protein
VIRGGAVAAVAVALLAAAGTARGALDVPGVPNGPLRVALLSTTPDDPLAGRIDAELGTIGIDVARAVVSASSGIEEQVHAAIAAGARAVIVADGHRTDVWISEPGSARIGLRQELEVDQASGLQAVLALRTVEFLRISLGLVVEPPVEPVATAGPPAVARAVPSAAAAPPARWITTGASAGVLAASGGGGTTVIAGVSARAQVTGMLAAELSLYAPLTEAATVTADGESRTSAWMAGGGLVLAPRSDGRLSFELGAGSLATFVRSQGVSVSASVQNGQTGTEWLARPAIYGRGAARVRLLPRLSLRIDLYGGAVIDAPPIFFGPGVVATWGPGFAGAVGGAEISL